MIYKVYICRKTYVGKKYTVIMKHQIPNIKQIRTVCRPPKALAKILRAPDNTIWKLWIWFNFLLLKLFFGEVQRHAQGRAGWLGEQGLGTRHCHFRAIPFPFKRGLQRSHRCLRAAGSRLGLKAETWANPLRAGPAQHIDRCSSTGYLVLLPQPLIRTLCPSVAHHPARADSHISSNLSLHLYKKETSLLHTARCYLELWDFHFHNLPSP